MQPPQRPSFSAKHATALALAIILLAGAGYRHLSAALHQEARFVPLIGEGLAAIPKEIGEWRGIELPLEQAIIQRTDTDAHLSRIYRRPAGPDISVFIGYGGRARDLLPHRPEVCYPSAGWVPRGARTDEVLSASGEAVPIKVHTFTRGGFDQRTLVVLNYYIVDGMLTTDVEQLRSVLGRGGGARRYLCQLQLATQVELRGSVEQSEEALRTFAALAADSLRDVLAAAQVKSP